MQSLALYALCYFEPEERVTVADDSYKLELNTNKLTTNYCIPQTLIPTSHPQLLLCNQFVFYSRQNNPFYHIWHPSLPCCIPAGFHSHNARISLAWSQKVDTPVTLKRPCMCLKSVVVINRSLVACR